MPDYPLIADHGLIGDLQTSALVSTDGDVDWFCAPRFDSPSVFGSLLDHAKGGRCRVRPVGDGYNTKQLYIPDTAVLVTRFMTEEGVGEVLDFMPVSSSTRPSDTHQLIRMLRCVRGRMTFDMELSPRFDYGRDPHQVEITPRGIIFRASRHAMTAHLVREPDDARLAVAEISGDNDLHAQFTLHAGQLRGMMLETGTAGPTRDLRPADIEQIYDETVRFWERWVAQSTYSGRWRETLHRSAITLKLLTYAPTGGLVAAPTAGLPEQIGGERNWDYRYTWIRDASFSVYSLLGLGFTEEAAGFAAWLRDRATRLEGSDTGPLNIMYRVDGSPDLGETVLEHWEGYRGSYPVRIGNGAAGQLQLDIYGEVMDSLYAGDRHGLQMGHIGWQSVTKMLDWVADHWDQPEEGIWETRGGRKDFTYGRLMSWVALDRGVRLALEHGRPAPVESWRRQRDAIYDQIMARGWSPARKAFVQHYDTPGARLGTAADVHRRFRHTARPDVAVHTGRDEQRAGDRQPGLPLRPRGLPGRSARLGGHLLAVHVRLRRRTRAGRAGGPGPAHLREDAHLREPPGAVLRGGGAHGRADRQLPAGVHPPRADRCRDHARRRARPCREHPRG